MPIGDGEVNAAVSIKELLPTPVAIPNTPHEPGNNPPITESTAGIPKGIKSGTPSSKVLNLFIASLALELRFQTPDWSLNAIVSP
jgi:hypothetical protein